MYKPIIDIVRSRLGWLALGLMGTAACGRVCDGKNAGCIALQVSQNSSTDPVYVEVLDAFGHRLDLRHTDPMPHDLIEVPVEGYDAAAARCLRVSVGQGQNRRTALMRITIAPAGSTPISVALMQPRDKAMFSSSPLTTTLQNPGRSVVIGRVPKAPLPTLLVGSMDEANKVGKVEFFRYDGQSGLVPSGHTPLDYPGSPYPLALAGTADDTAILVIGENPLAPKTPPTQPRVFTANPAGGFASGRDLPQAAGAQTTFVAAADLDRDGKAEVVTNWLDMSGAGSCGSTLFKPPNYMQTTNIAHSGPSQCSKLSALAIADVDGDGLPDILRSIDGGVTAFLGLGSFMQPLPVLGNQMKTLLGLTVGDLNGDRVPDLAIATNSDVTQSMPDNMVTVVLGNLSSGNPTANPLILTTKYPRAAVAADINGDFLDDILVASYGPPGTPAEPVLVSYGSSQPPTKFEPLVQLPSAAQNVFDIAMGDLNGDCQVDLALTAINTNMVYVFLNKTLPLQ